MNYSESDKLQHEVEKLIQEVRVLKRPYLHQPTSWLAIIGLMVSIGVNFSQCYRVEAANLKEEEANHATLVNQRLIDSLQIQYDLGMEQLQGLQKEIQIAMSELEKLQADSSTGTKSPEVTNIKASLDRIRKTNIQTVDGFKRNNPKMRRAGGPRTVEQ